MAEEQKTMSEVKQHVWSDPPALFVTNLVHVLKRTRRWNRDGRALRQLNKQWCLEVNRHIVAVNPGQYSSLTCADLARLTKFPQLTSLNMNHLYGLGSIESGELGNAISRLKNLNHLEFSLCTLARMQNYVTAIMGVTSLVVKGLIATRDLEMLSQLHLRRLGCSCNPNDLEQMLSWFPQLEHLDADVFEMSKCESPDLKELANLETLKLNLRCSCRSLDFLSGITSLVALRFWYPHGVKLEVFTTLPLLACLSASVCYDEGLKSCDSFFSVLPYLTSLSLYAIDHRQIPVPVEFADQLVNVQSLTLKNFHLLDIGPMPTLRNVTGLLCLSTILGSGMMDFLSSLKHLRRLALVDFYWRSDSDHIPLNLSTLPELTDLILEVKHNHLAWTRMTGGLTKLEKLSILYRNPTQSASDLLSELGGLSNLRLLEIVNIPVCKADEWELYLKQWTELEALHINSFSRYDRDIEAMATDLRRRFPHLKASYSLCCSSLEFAMLYNSKSRV